jgi:hypothetical protein
MQLAQVAALSNCPSFSFFWHVALRGWVSCPPLSHIPGRKKKKKEDSATSKNLRISGNLRKLQRQKKCTHQTIHHGIAFKCKLRSDVSINQWMVDEDLWEFYKMEYCTNIPSVLVRK